MYVTAYDACKSNPCKNGATCTKNNLGFRCMCSANYDGTTCACECYLVSLNLYNVYTMWFDNTGMYIQCGLITLRDQETKRRPNINV